MNQFSKSKLLVGISVCTMLFGLTALAEYVLDIKLLGQIFPDYALIRVNTAVCFILAGYAFFLLLTGTPTILKKLTFLGSSVAVVVFGAVSLGQELQSVDRLLEFIFINDFGVDDNRMATISAGCFILLGIAFIALNSIFYKTAGQYLLHLITVGSFIAMIGYLYDVPSFYTLTSDIAMAVQSALAFLVLSIAATHVNPHLGITGILRGQKIGNITARKIFPFVLLFGILNVMPFHLNFFSANFGSALFTTLFILGGLVILCLTSSKLNRIDEKRTEAESQIIGMNQKLENTVEMRTAQLVSANNALLEEITERKRTEASLREVSDRFSKVFHSSPSGKAITVPYFGNDHAGLNESILCHKVVEINKSFLEILGYGRDEVVCDDAINLEIIINDEQSKELNHLLKTTGHFKNKEAALRRKDGKIQDCILSVEPIDIEGESHFLWVCYDNSERKKMEKQLHKAKETAEHLAQVKEQFLANMSHEIRTPMNAIIGFSSMLGNTSLDSTQRSYVSTINIAGTNLLELINEILDYTKIESGKIGVKKAAFTLRHSLQTIYRMFMEKAREKGLRLSVTFDKELPVRIVGDESKLNQILMNLVGNAFKFTSQGIVHIHCSLLERKKHTLKVKFTVKDTGIGIASENIAGVFERFNQANSKTSREYGGTGLGLAIVKQLVEVQGGEISLQSIPGTGSEFSFTLQYEEFVAEEAAAMITHAAPRQKINLRSRVLLAEDNVMNQKLAVAQLKNAGCEIDIAENGMEAIEMLKMNRYDIVFMDIQMPILDGYRAAQHIREDLKSDIPIVAITAHAFTGEREKCLSYGMNDYLTKPYSEEDLLVMLLKYLPGKNTVYAADHYTESDTNQNAEYGFFPEQQPSAEADTRITNLSYLQEISRGNKAFVAEMIEDFLSQNTEHLNRLEYAVAKRHFDVIGKTVHSMKNTVNFVGLHTVMGDNLRTMAKLAETRKDFEELRRNFHIVQAQCLKAQEELRAATTA